MYVAVKVKANFISKAKTEEKINKTKEKKKCIREIFDEKYL